jgi:hypothetical protein
VTTVRSVHDQIKNALDYLEKADLVLYPNRIAMSGSRVSWHSLGGRPFLPTRDHPSIEQYLAWLEDGAYSAILFDGSLLQFTYDVEGGRVLGHRLAYVPCPFDVDLSLLSQGEPVADVVALYRGGDAALRSPIRFDYDPGAAERDHPAVHMTLNTTGCRIACVAPMHVLRFVDFVFRCFYSELWKAHRDFFRAAAWLHIPAQAFAEDERLAPHLAWNVSATEAQVPDDVT